LPRSRKGFLKPLKTLWRSTLGVQSPSTLPTHVFAGGYNGGPCKKNPKTDDFQIHEHHIYHVEIACFW
jgi:hypothetical protein